MPRGKEGGSVDKHQKLTEDYFKRSDHYRQMARAAGVSETEFLESCIPPSERSKSGASVIEVMHWHRHGVDLIGRGYTNSSPLNKIGDFTSEQFNKTDDAKLAWEWLEDTYSRALQTGASPEELANMSPDTRMPGDQNRLSSLSGLEANTAENPWQEESMILTKQWEPQIDYRRIVASVSNTSRSSVRIPYNTTEDNPEHMAITPEGTAPLVVELGYSRDNLYFSKYGASLVATDEYLLDNQTTAAAIREEVAKLAMRRREALFHDLIVAIYNARLAANVYHAGSLTSAAWNQFRKKYENYQMQIMLGTPSAISQWEDMYFGVGGNRTVTMDFFSRRGTGSNPTSLNNQPTIPDYGWVSREKTKFVDRDTATDVFSDGTNFRFFTLTFDRRHTIRVWFRRGLAQDETERMPGESKMARHFKIDVGWFVPDANSIWAFTWNAPHAVP